MVALISSFSEQKGQTLIPLFADVIVKLCEGGNLCISCKATRKCATCGAVNHSLTDQNLTGSSRVHLKHLGAIRH